MTRPPATPDRRKVKTIASLRTALIDLVLEKHYDEITVQDIIDRANVGRSTFYSHFRDKEDLLIGDWKKFLGLIAAHVNLDASLHEPIAPVEALMMHLKDYHALYRALARSGKTDRLFAVGTDYLAQAIEEKLKGDTGKAENLPVSPEVFAYFLSLQIFGILKWWLDHNMPYSPAEMGRMFQALVGPALSTRSVTPPISKDNVCNHM